MDLFVVDLSITDCISNLSGFYILNNTNDGFKIASEDLKLRGPGDLFGIRQSGLMDFKLGDIYQDAKLLQYASEAAEWIMTNHQDWIQDLEKNEKNTSVIL